VDKSLLLNMGSFEEKSRLQDNPSSDYRTVAYTAISAAKTIDTCRSVAQPLLALWRNSLQNPSVSSKVRRRGTVVTIAQCTRVGRVGTTRVLYAGVHCTEECFARSLTDAMGAVGRDGGLRRYRDR
jgi:hypothetical protein